MTVGFGNMSILGHNLWFVTHIWAMDIHGITQTFLNVVLHKQLSEEDQHHDPWHSWPGFRNHLVYSRSRLAPIIIKPSSIVSHAPRRIQAEGTYPGVTRRTLLVHGNLNLGHR
jgi:hypothetical protein